MLSTAEGGDSGKLSEHHKRLRKELERKLGFEGVQHFQVETTEGNGVLHVVWAWKGERKFYVEQKWLSEQWERIHGAPIVWVSRIGATQADRDKVGRYTVAQYCGDQSGFVRFSWSWWSLSVKLGKCWESLKRRASVTFVDGYTSHGRPLWRREYLVTMKEMIAAWEALLREGEAMLNGNLVVLTPAGVEEIF